MFRLPCKTAFALSLALACLLLDGSSRPRAESISYFDPGRPVDSFQPADLDSALSVGHHSEPISAAPDKMDAGAADDAPGELPEQLGQARIWKPLALQPSQPTGGLNGSGSGPEGGSGGQLDSLFSRTEIPRSELIVFASFDDKLLPPSPFLFGLFRPPRALQVLPIRVVFSLILTDLKSTR
jgi:hypothetical protein